MAIDLANFASGGPWGLGWPGCCCEPDCLIFEDYFDNTPSTTLSDDWAEISGDWSYVGPGYLQAAGAGLVQCLVPHHKGEESMVVNAETFNEQTGDKFSVLVNYLDEDNYHEAEAERTVNSIILTLYSVIDGSRTQLAQDTIGSITGTARSINVCIAPGVFSATVTDSPNFDVWYEDPGIVAGGVYCGLKNAGTSTIKWNSIIFSEHYITNNVCPACRCWCGDNLIGKDLVLTFQGSGCCSCGSGSTISLEWDKLTDNWIGSGTVGGVTFDAQVTCGQSDVTNWGLSFEATSCLAGDLSKDGNAGSSCEPLSITFGPWVISADDLECDICNRLSGCYMDPETLLTVCPAGAYSWVLTEAA